MMYAWLVVTVVASSATCTLSQATKQNAPTHVPRRCFLDKAPGRCNDYQRNYYFNLTAGHCQPFVYGGCAGNWNRFTSLSECQRTCTCAIPPETGPCRGHIRRWFYSPEDGCCRPFIYGGCGGNRNRYATWTECSENCGYPTADSSWWTWGAQWGNGSSGQSTGQTSGSNSSVTGYTRNDFMRDWMLWSLLSGGEGFEMEDIATVIGQAHILGLGNSMAGAGSAGTGFGLGSQMFGQEGANGFGAALGGSAMQGSGFGNLGPAYQTRPGSFTPLGHVGSEANLMNGEFSESMASANAAWNQLEAAGLVGGTQRSGIQSQGSMGQNANSNSNWGFDGQNINAGLGQRWGEASGSGMFGSMQGGMSGFGNVGTSGARNPDISNSIAAEMSGQGSWGSHGIGQFNPRNGGFSGRGEASWVHGEGQWNRGASPSKNIFDIGWGALGHRGFGPVSSNPKEVGNTAIEILHLIGQIGRGALGPSDLINLGTRYGAVSPTGHVDINLLATRLVSELQGPRGEMNMARLKGVAQRLGALDSNGNINLPHLVRSISGSLSSRGLGNNGVPSLDEFNWLGSQKGSTGLGSSGTGQRGSTGGVNREGGPLLGGGRSGSLMKEGFGTRGIEGIFPSQGGGVSRSRLGMRGAGGGRGIEGGAVGGISGAIRGLMGRANRDGAGGAHRGGMGGGLNSGVGRVHGGGMGGSNRGGPGGFLGAGADGLGSFGGASGTVAVQTVNVKEGNRRMGSYGKK